MSRHAPVGFPNIGNRFSVHDYIPGQPIPALILDPDTKRPIVNPLKKWVTPYTLVTDPGEITLAAGALSEPIPMVIDKKGHLEIFDAFFESEQPEGFTVTLFDANEFGPQARPILMNREIHVSSIASGAGISLPLSGSFPASTAGGRPYRWPQTFWMDASKDGAMIVAVFRNLSQSENTVRFNLHGRRWYYMQAPGKVADRMAEIYRNRPRTIPYFYTTDEDVVLEGDEGPTKFQLRMGDDSWSEWVKASCVRTGSFDVLIRDTSTGKSLMGPGEGVPVIDSLVFGSGEFPFLNWENSLFEPNFKLTFELTDLSGEDNSIWLTLAARKIFEDPKDKELLRPGTSPGR
jgi:hypothetical protein